MEVSDVATTVLPSSVLALAVTQDLEASHALRCGGDGFRLRGERNKY